MENLQEGRAFKQPSEVCDVMPCPLTWLKNPCFPRWAFWSSGLKDELDYQRRHVPLMAAAAADRVVPSKRIVEEFIRSNYPIVPTFRGVSLVQFWAPVKVNGSTFLSTGDQPFIFSTNLDKRLCSYRRLCLDTLIPINNCPVGRVFRSGIPEFNPDLQSYSAGEFPLLENAIQLGIRCCWATPCLTNRGQDCLGVLEISTTNPTYYPQLPPKPLDALFPLNQIGAGLDVVCKIHSLPFAQIWNCNSQTYNGKALSMDGSRSYDSSRSIYDEFAYASNFCYIQWGKGVVGRAFLSKSSCFCKDVTLLSLTEYPLVPTARKARLSRCFAICLRSKCAKNFICVVEYFLPPDVMVDRDAKKFLSMLLSTMKEKLPDFIVASGKELGQRMLVEVVKVSQSDELDSFEIGQPLPSVQLLQDGGNITEIDSLLQQSNLQNVENNVTTVQHSVQVDILPPVTKRGTVNMDIAHDDHIEFEEDKGEMMQFDSHFEQPNVETDSLGNARSNDKLEHNDISRCLPPVEAEAIHEENNFICGAMSSILKIDSQKNNIPRIEKDHGITLEILKQQFGKPLVDAAKTLSVSRSTLKRICREYDISRWPHHKSRKVHHHVSQGVSLQGAESYVGHQQCPVLSKEKGIDHLAPERFPATRKTCDGVMTVKVTYRGDIIKFKLTPASTRVELEGEVEKKFNISLQNFLIKYQDEDDDWILITSDSDLREGMLSLRSLGRTTMKLLVSPKSDT